MNTDIDLQQAVIHHQAEQFVEAENLYRAILETQPGHAEANHNLGILAVQLKQPMEGLPFFEAAVAAAPEQRDYWAVYAEALILAGQRDKATQVLEQARERGLAFDAIAAAPAKPNNESGSEPIETLASEFVATLETLSEKGLDDSAEELARQMVQLLPDHGFGWKTLAYAYLRRGDLAGALVPLTKATTLCPHDEELQRHHRASTAMREGLELDAKREFANAGVRYQEVLATYPDHPDANHKLGVIGIRLGQPEAAVTYLERALGRNPNQNQYWANYVDALLQSGQTKAAWMALQMGQQRGLSGPAVDDLVAIMTAMTTVGSYQLRQKQSSAGADITLSADVPPDSGSTPDATSLSTLAPQDDPDKNELERYAALFNAGHTDEALIAARGLVKRYPGHGFGWKLLTLLLYRTGRYDDSLESMATALKLWPDDIDLLQASAAIHESNGHHREAEAACRSLLKLDPNHLEGLRVLSIVLMSLSRVREAEEVCLKATQVAPNSALVHCTLGVLYIKLGRLVEACESFCHSIELDPEHELSYNNLAFCYAAREDVSPADVFARHSLFGEHFEPRLKPLWSQHDNSKDPDRQLRIGFISGDFCHHAVANFIEPLLVHLSQDSSLSLYAYSNTPIRDHVTERIRQHFATWHHIFGQKDDQVAALIGADHIDILIDLSGHTAHNRLLTMARKPAPVQASWIGYPGTTGLKSVDYFLADRFWVPSEQFRNQFTEKIVYLPAVAPFLPDRMCPPVNLLPAMHKGYVTFGSFNRVDKLRPEVIALWSELLHAVPNAKLMIGGMPSDGSRGEFVEWFAEDGITPDRIDFRARASVPVYLQQHHHVDICLDSFPYSGLTTVLHSLWMGVPTITLPGQTVPGRSGLTAMSHVGLEQFVARDKADYVAKAVALASDLAGLAELRSTLRERCTQSPMFRPDFIAAGATEALRIMWRHWCEGLAPESFDVSKLTEIADAQ
jgi:tetratricopeptide (TPR) repeat protein